MKRIKPKTVAQAFKQKKLLPAAAAMQGYFENTGDHQGSTDFCTKVTCACGLGVLLPIDNSGIDGCEYDAVANKLGVTRKYTESFAQGFDGDAPTENKAELIQAYLDGLNAHLETLKTLGYLTNKGKQKPKKSAKIFKLKHSSVTVVASG